MDSQYQRNDYPGWFERPKRPETEADRLQQMLDELEQGDVYMKMAWRMRRPRGLKSRVGKVAIPRPGLA